MLVFSEKMKILTAVLISFLVGAFYLLTIKTGHNWGGDFAMYIHHAQNIAEGKAYQNTGYILNPPCARWGPLTYPPVFPLLLAPVYKLFGLNFVAMKAEIIVLFMAFLVVLAMVFQRDLTISSLAALIAIIGFNPFFYNFTDNIISDIPFLFFLYLLFFFINKTYDPPRHKYHSLWHGALLGVLIYLSYGTRSVGILMVPALLIFEALKFRRVTKTAVTAILVFFGLMAVQNTLLHNDSSYLALLMQKGSGVILPNVVIYAKSLSLFWENGHSKIFRIFVCGLVSCFAVRGYLLRIKKGITIFEVFVPIYIIAILVWPSSSRGLRFLLPVIPLYIFYALQGLRDIPGAARNRFVRFIPVLLGVLIFLTYAAQYARTGFNPAKEGVTKLESQKLFDFVIKNTKEDDAFIFYKPRVLSLYTGRKAAVYLSAQDEGELIDYMHSIHAEYLIIGERFDRQGFLRDVVRRFPDAFREVYANPDFRVYRLEEGMGI